MRKRLESAMHISNLWLLTVPYGMVGVAAIAIDLAR